MSSSLHPVRGETGMPSGELIQMFLRLGFTAFGGPAAHIALLKEEVVTRRKWVTEAEFLDLLGATNLIPGPNSTEMAIHIGFLRGGWQGLLIGGACFILPAALIVCGFAWAYLRFGSVPAVAGILYGVKPVVIAVVVQAMVGLVKPAIKNVLLGIVGLAVLIGALFGVTPLYLLFGAGVIMGTVAWGKAQFVTRTDAIGWRPLLILLGIIVTLAGLPSLLTAFLPSPQGNVPFSLSALFLFFLKVGSVLYGSGYVLLAFLREGLVTHWHWLTEAQLLDAVAVGQVTPGPVFTTATFIGYVLGGPTGAAVATLGIFLPSFVFVALSGPFVPRLRKSPLASAFLDGVNVAALALMASVVYELCRTALVDAPTAVIALISAVLLLRFKVNSAWLLLGAAVVGVLHTFFH